MPQNRYNIGVHGALALVLYVSRLLFAAPLVFTTRGVRVSRFLSHVGRVFVTLMGIVVIIEAYFYISYKDLPFWAITTGAVLIRTVIAVYSAASRMRLYLQSLQCLNQINEDINGDKLREAEKKIDLILKYYGVICLITNTALFTYNFIIKSNTFYGHFDIGYVSEMIIRCYERSFVTILIMQFALLTLRVMFTLKNVNEHFGLVVERHSVIEVSSVRQLAFSYMSVSDVVSQVVEQDEILIVLILITFITSLCYVIYISIVDILISISSVDILKYNVQGNQINLIHLLNMVFTYLTYLVLLIEPCHRVHEEMATTYRITCKTMQLPNLSVQVANELAAFKLLLKLNKPTYSLLGVCTLARPLFLKIVGTLISYVVFCLQLPQDFFHIIV